jgi:Sulfotransferase family
VVKKLNQLSLTNVPERTPTEPEHNPHGHLVAVHAEKKAYRDLSIMRNWFPQFFGVGPARTATTWLHNVLAPQINLPVTVKETRFLDMRYKRGWRWYRAQFNIDHKKRSIGEIGPTYFHSDLARTRMKEHAPGARIICTFRDPVERLYSLYRYLRFHGSYSWSFEYAMTHDQEMIESARYAHYFSAWIRDFSRSQVLGTIYDDIERDTQAYVDAICDFIEIPRFTLLPSQKARVNTSEDLRAPTSYALLRFSNAMGAIAWALRFRSAFAFARSVSLKMLFFGQGRELPPLNPDFAAELRKRLTPEIEQLESIIGRDLSAWKV